MNRHLRAAAAAALSAACSASFAHISYTNRNFGSFDGLSAASVTIANQTVAGNFGWADAVDADYGDSHKAQAFRFHLDNAAWVSVEVSAHAAATPGSSGGLLPGFSIYQGLAHIAPAAADHDFAAITTAYLASLPGVAKEGAWVALGDWRIGNDSGTTFADLSSFLFKGYAVDGTPLNFGNHDPRVSGDGLADGRVKGSFLLGAGDYSVFVGGADDAAQDPSNPNWARAYGVSVTLGVTPVPEPQSALLLAGGLLMLGALHGRRQADR